jgi:hypothetical protein
MGGAIALVLAVVLLQIESGAYRSDFDANDDEPGHVVSSLMIRDYFASGRHVSPLRFAEEYYIHYPRVAIGHWPPGFHSCEALWMLAFGRNRTAMLSFVAAAEAALILSVFVWLRRRCGIWIAFVSASVLATARCMQAATAAVTPDILLALLLFWVTVMYARYCRTGQRRDLWWAAILGVLALGIHGRAAILLLLPSAAALLGKRFTKFHVALIVPLLLILVFAPGFLGQAGRPHVASSGRHALLFVIESFRAAGWPIMCVAIIALAGGLSGILRFASVPPEWTTAGALLVASLVFYTLVHVPLQANYMIATTPAAVALFAFGWQSIEMRYRTHSRLINGFMAVLALSTIGFHMLPPVRMPDLGARQVILRLSSLEPPSRVWLVAGSALFEGTIIAETAIMERSTHIVLRSSKVLARSTWSGEYYRTRFSGIAEIDAYLDSVHARWIIVEAAQERPDIRQLTSVMEEYPSKWSERTDLALPPNVRLFERTGEMPSGPLEIHLDMRDKLGSILSLRE